MLADSFNTEFPTNAILTTAIPIVDPIQFVVMDGTTVILDVSPILTLEATNDTVISSSSAFSQTTIGDQTAYRGRGNSKSTSLVTLKYNDSGWPTKDGTTTRFSVTGLQKTPQKVFLLLWETYPGQPRRRIQRRRPGNFFQQPLN